MIDHLIGRPNPSWKRVQVFLVILFWLWRLLCGNPSAPRMLWLRSINRYLHRFTPWQIIVGTLTAVYTVRNFDKILGLGAPEPLADLYTPAYYRATWIATGLDAGFATAMSIRPRWLRDICSVVFSAYYIIYANEADEKLRRFRAVPTVEMLRTTWEKTGNPYLRALSLRPPVSVRRKMVLARPSSSAYTRPMTVYMFFAPPESQLGEATDLILDIPGGGFVAMTPEHHEERLRLWARKTGRPVLSVEYGKAPEYPYPFAIEECFDVYRVLVESVGACIGMSGKKLNIIMSGDSAGATFVVTVMFKIIEYNSGVRACGRALPRPVALVLSYAALDFNFTSWMTPGNVRVFEREECSGNVGSGGVEEDVSPLSMVGDAGAGLRRGGVRMSSRTGYFQDRIIAPSMMRAMAILYIGGEKADFWRDYYVSPIVAPREVLEQFPRVLMQCGEKDPFVDDTVIFGGRVREAKGTGSVEVDILRGWSHGYLQMGSVMREARTVIESLGEWMREAFEGGREE